MKILIIVDMQKDFITGSLANKDAEAIVPKICNYIKTFEGPIFCTFDTHKFDYIFTQEGHKLPVPHCIKGSSGWNLDDSIFDALEERRKEMTSNKKYANDASLSFKAQPIFIEKPTFGYLGWKDLQLDLIGRSSLKQDVIDEIILVGTCTDICVISNALILKASYPNIKVTCLKDLCAGVTKEKHEAAISVVESCQVEIK